MGTYLQNLRPRCSRTGALGYLAAALAVALLDQGSKAAVLASLALGETRPALPGLFSLTYVRNTGAAWSILSGATGLLSAISIAAILALGLYTLCGNLCPQARLCLSLVIGGAAGNLIDRLRLGFVVDMVDLDFMDFPVFNVGDSFIVVGGILFAVLFLFYNDNYLIAHGLLEITEKAEESHDDHLPS